MTFSESAPRSARHDITVGMQTQQRRGTVRVVALGVNDKGADKLGAIVIDLVKQAKFVRPLVNRAARPYAHGCCAVKDRSADARGKALRAALRAALGRSSSGADGTHAVPSTNTSADGAHAVSRTDSPADGAHAVPLSSRAADRTRRERSRQAWRRETTEFVRSIASTGALIAGARDWDGTPIMPMDAQHALLSAVERTEGCPTFSDLARALGISRQGARECAVAAARAGTVELLPDPYDRRTVQVVLTPLGRRQLGSVREREQAWVAKVLNGLGVREMHVVDHVLRVIRRRIRRDEQERQRSTHGS